MWQRFTERARKVVFFAQDEAQKFGEGYVSTEHLLLGLVREPDSAAAKVLNQLGVSLARVRSEVEKQLPRGDVRHNPDMTLTPRAKRVIDLAYDEARNLNNDYIGTEHLLLGLVREGDGLAGRVLAKLAVELEVARRLVVGLQGEQGTHTGFMGPTVDDLVRVTMNSLGRALAEYWPNLTHPARDCLYEACKAASTDRCDLWPAHVFVAIAVDYTRAGRVMKELDVDLDHIRGAVTSSLTTALDKGPEGHVSDATVEVVSMASKIAEGMHHEHVGTEHLLLAIIERDVDSFASFGVTYDAVVTVLKAM